MAKKKITDAVAILHACYIKGDPKHLASLEREREKLQIAGEVHNRRTQAGLSQAKLAKLAGTTRSVISRLEDADYGTRSLNLLRRIARAFNCRLEVRFVPKRQERHRCHGVFTVTSPTNDLPVLHEIYTPPIITAIHNRADSKNRLDILYDTLTATNKRFGIARAYLSECLQFATDQHGLGEDRVSRLRKPTDYADWKAVHNELLVPYFFAKVFGLRIEFTTSATSGGLGDFQIVLPGDHIIVEVKTPWGDILSPKAKPKTKKMPFAGQAHILEEDRSEDGWHEDVDEHLLESVFRKAADQVQPGNKNLIVVCTRLCKSMHDSRTLEKLLYGHKKLSVAFDQKQGNTVETEFVPDGHLIRHHGKRLTRISAVASFRDDVIFQLPASAGQQQVHFAIFHNYHAECPIPPELFPGVEQFVANRERGRVEQINSGCDGFAIDRGTEIGQ